MGHVKHDGAAPDGFSDRFRAARKAAGFTSSEKLANQIGASRRAALRWETGESLPREYKEALAKISPEFAQLMAELPAEEYRRYDLAERVQELELRQEDILATCASLTRSLRALTRELRQVRDGLAEQ